METLIVGLLKTHFFSFLIIIGRLGPSCPPPFTTSLPKLPLVSRVCHVFGHIYCHFTSLSDTHSSTLKLFCSFWWWHCGEFTLFATLQCGRARHHITYSKAICCDFSIIHISRHICWLLITSHHRKQRFLWFPNISPGGIPFEVRIEIKFCSAKAG